MSKVKICGMTRPEDIIAANAAGPDYIGFVFAKASRRYVTPGQAAALRKNLSPGIRPVGVFVDEPAENIIKLFDTGVIELAQLHGREDSRYIEELRARSHVPLINAVSVSSAADIERAAATSADYVLLDHGSGGTGSAFDWRWLGGVTSDGRLRTGIPFFLAGGIDLSNIENALTFNPYAIDVSSGAETDGLKDGAKIAELVSIVRDNKRK
jgi:phosphoribosylanthranilate isomerase